MHGDALFRIVLLLGIISIVPVGVFHRVKAQAAGDRFNRREEGLIMFLALRPLGVAAMAGLLLFVIQPRWMAWSSMSLPDGVRWIGAGIGVIAGALFIWTLRTLGPNLTDTIGTRARHTLVTRGPYRWVRHPFYAASALAVTANALAAANWFIGATGAAAASRLGLPSMVTLIPSGFGATLPPLGLAASSSLCAGFRSRTIALVQGCIAAVVLLFNSDSALGVRQEAADG